MSSVLDPAVADSLRHIPEELWRGELGSGVVIRIANPDEYEEVGDVLEQAFTTGCWSTPEYVAGLHRIAERAQRANVWVAADAEGILGAVLTPQPQLHDDSRFTFNILGVGHRGRGKRLGEALTRHAIEVARGLNYPVIEIHSGAQMTAAHAIYYRLGFVRRYDWETIVVDGGQRLLSFTLRLDEVSEANPTKGIDVTQIQQLRPQGGFDPAGRFVLAPAKVGGRGPWPGATTLVVPVDSPLAWPVLFAARHSGVDLAISYEAGAGPARLLGRAGELLSDDPRALLFGFLEVAEVSNAGWQDRIVRAEVQEGLLTALFAEQQPVREAALRLFYARLGELELDLAANQERELQPADFVLFGVLLGFDRWYRSHLGWGAASLVDYPNLWCWARRLFSWVTAEEKVWLGITPGQDGTKRRPWGDPLPVEGVDDLDAAWG